MIYSLWFRRYAPFAEFGLGFEGDHRIGPSASMKETARTAGGVSFGPDYIGPGLGTSSGTKHTKFAKIATSKVTSSVTCTTRSMTELRFTAQTAGANPLAPGAPDIDTFVDMHVVFGAMSMNLDGTVRGDTFPNAELFIYDGVGKSVLLWSFSTTGGKDSGPFTRLAGSHDTAVLGTFAARLPLKASGALVAPP